MVLTRRRALRTAGATTLAALAGCSSVDPLGADDPAPEYTLHVDSIDASPVAHALHELDGGALFGESTRIALDAILPDGRHTTYGFEPLPSDSSRRRIRPSLSSSPTPANSSATSSSARGSTPNSPPTISAPPSKTCWSEPSLAGRTPSRHRSRRRSTGSPRSWPSAPSIRWPAVDSCGTTDASMGTRCTSRHCLDAPLVDRQSVSTTD